MKDMKRKNQPSPSLADLSSSFYLVINIFEALNSAKVHGCVLNKCKRSILCTNHPPVAAIWKIFF